MKKALVLSLLAIAFAPCSYAANAKSENDFHVAVGLGLTAGGDSLARAEYTNGDTAKIYGGGLIQLGAGVYYHKPSVPLSVLLTINYHVDQASARNGNMQFDRWPLELIGYYHINDSWRIGAGLRHVMSPSLKVDIDYQPSTKVDYEDTNSPVAEVAWGKSWGRKNYWVALRYVHENLKVKRVSIGDQPVEPALQTEDGSHFGVFIRYAF